MEAGPGVVERVIHTLLFVAAGVGLGTAALALVERVTASGPAVVRIRYVAWAAAGFGVLLGAERLYHALV